MSPSQICKKKKAARTRPQWTQPVGPHRACKALIHATRMSYAVQTIYLTGPEPRTALDYAPSLYTALGDTVKVETPGMHNAQGTPLYQMHSIGSTHALRILTHPLPALDLYHHLMTHPSVCPQLM